MFAKTVTTSKLFWFLELPLISYHVSFLVFMWLFLFEKSLSCLSPWFWFSVCISPGALRLIVTVVHEHENSYRSMFERSRAIYKNTKPLMISSSCATHARLSWSTRRRLKDTHQQATNTRCHALLRCWCLALARPRSCSAYRRAVRPAASFVSKVDTAHPLCFCLCYSYC